MVRIVLAFTFLQINMFDCFPASTYIVMRHLGARVSYQTVLDSAPAANPGYKADPSFVSRISDLQASWSYTNIDAFRVELESGDPLVWCKNLPGRGHCVVVHGIDDKSLMVFDPLFGEEEIYLDEMPGFMYPQGYFIILFDGKILQQKSLYRN